MSEYEKFLQGANECYNEFNSGSVSKTVVKEEDDNPKPPKCVKQKTPTTETRVTIPEYQPVKQQSAVAPRSKTLI